ncbi:MAG: hypothetical protein KGY76_06280 [Candidatus Thermoplasmatota archaeon]|nr:hypothetical protein [Candidatus Thermoplasmatota archaeon]
MEIEKRYLGLPDGVSEKDFELSVYRDKECTEEVKNIDFGPIEPGEEKSRWYWLKNTGEVHLSKVYVGMGIIHMEGWESRTDAYSAGSLEVGEKCLAAFQLKVAPETEPGNYSGSIPITVYGSESMV